MLGKVLRAFISSLRPRHKVYHPETGTSTTDGSGVDTGEGYRMQQVDANGKCKTKNHRKGRYKLDDTKAGEDGCSKLWSVYVNEAEKYDGELVRGWKQDMEGLLIFSALYSASLTAFIIESYKTLQQDPTETTVTLLLQISQQLADASNGKTVTFREPDTFQPAASSLLCNMLWFIALVLALTCSLLATFVQQWTRDFIHKTNMRPSPIVHARILMYAYFGMRDFKMHTVVDVIPFLLHLSLVSFLTGLVAFLVPINGPLGYLMAAILFFFVLMYFLLTLLPILYLDAPYRTPLSNTIWYWGNRFGRWLQNAHGLRTNEDLSLTESALQKSSSNQYYERAMEFTMKSLTDDSELLPLIEAIPDAIYDSGRVRSANLPLLSPFLTSTSPTLNIVSHIADFSNNSSTWLDKQLSDRCLTAYPRALWSLAFALLNNVPKSENLDVTSVWFPQSIVSRLKAFAFDTQVDIAQVHSAASALALVRISQLRSLHARVVAFNAKLLDDTLLNSDIQPYAIEILRDIQGVDWSPSISVGYDRNLEVFQATRVIPLWLGPQGGAWAMAEIHIRRHFLVESMLEKEFLYELLPTHQSLIQTMKVENILSQLDASSLHGYLQDLCEPIRRVQYLNHSTPTSDLLFLYALGHFCTDEEVANSRRFVSAIECRKFIQQYFVDKVYDAPQLCKSDQLLNLEACILMDFNLPSGDPDKYLPAAWKILHCLLQIRDIQSLYRFGRKLFRPIRELNVTHHLYPYILGFTNGILCLEMIDVLEGDRLDVIEYGVVEDILQCIRILGLEFLPEQWVFDGFSLPRDREAPLTESQLAQVRNLASYTMNLNLMVISNYLESFISAREVPFYREVFEHMANIFKYYEPESDANIDETGQLRFANAVLAISAKSIPMHEAIMKMDYSFMWITSLGAAKILLKTIEKYSPYSQDPYRETLRERCETIISLEAVESIR